MQTIGQIIGFIFACFLLRLAYKFFHREKWTQSVFAFWASVFVLLCSFSWFQGWAKSFIASNISSRLTAISEQVNTVQETTAAMQKQLENHQGEITKNQTELNEVQAKIRFAESNVFSQQSDITNQFQQISLVQSNLNSVQMNILVQQEKLTNIEALVNTLYSSTEDEVFETADTNRIVILKQPGRQIVLIKLKYIPVPNSVQGIASMHGTQMPISPQVGYLGSIIVLQFDKDTDINGHFEIRYIKTKETNGIVKTMMLQKPNTVYFDGVPYNWPN